MLRLLHTPLTFPARRGIVNKTLSRVTSCSLLRNFSNGTHSSPDVVKLSNSEKKSSPVVSKEFWTLPNVITLSRICASPLLVYAIANDMKTVALTGCIVGGISDWLDGYIAKNHNQMSVWGGVLDPIADKVFIGCLASGLALKGLFPTTLLGIILGRDIFLLTFGAIFRAMERPEGAPFFDSETATFEIVPTTLSKVNTALQFVLLVATLSHFSWDIPTNVETLAPLWYITGTTTAVTFVQYLDGSGMKTIDQRKRSKNFTWK